MKGIAHVLLCALSSEVCMTKNRFIREEPCRRLFCLAPLHFMWDRQRVDEILASSGLLTYRTSRSRRRKSYI